MGLVAALGVAALPLAQALLVPPTSNCSTSCGNVLDTTFPDDIACLDNSFGSDPGAIYQGCVKCEISSSGGTAGNTDIQAGLYNLRYAVSSCLWGVPSPKTSIGDTPCVTSKACGPYMDAIVHGNLTKNDGYGYCDLWPVSDSVDFAACNECLRVQDMHYLANFFTTLQAGCVQKPDPGRMLGLQGNIFSTASVNVTSPPPLATVNPDWFDHGPLTLGAKVGIAFGGLAFLLFWTGVFIICNGKRSRRAYLKKLDETRKAWPAAPGGYNDHIDTPISQQGLRNWEASPMTETSERTSPRYVSPYASQFNSPVSPQDMINMSWPEAALPKNHIISPISPQEQAVAMWDSRADDKGKAVVDEYELDDVDTSGSEQQYAVPVMRHPGPGRNSASPPRTAEGHYQAQYAPGAAL